MATASTVWGFWGVQDLKDSGSVAFRVRRGWDGGLGRTSMRNMERVKYGGVISRRL